MNVRIEGRHPGFENMQRDEALLEACAAGDFAHVVRIYGFSRPCLSLGRFQDDCDVDVAACARDGVDVVRRPSGGSAVLHDEEVTYAVVCRIDDGVFGGGVLQSCSQIHAAIALGLSQLGVTAVAHAVPGDVRSALIHARRTGDCFAEPAAHELTDTHGRKLVGSAQARRGNALLQHGSVLLEPPRATAYLRSHAAPSGTGVRSLAGRRVSWAELASALATGFARYAYAAVGPPRRT
jgi:lipoate-protein ligase A